MMRNKKIYLIIILLVVLLIYGAVKENFSLTEINIRKRMENSSIYPLYNSLGKEEKEVYIDICIAIEDIRTSKILVGEYDSEKELQEAAEEFGIFFEKFYYEQPGYFWVNPYEYELSGINDDEEYRLFLKLSYIADEESIMEKREILSAEIDKIVAVAESKNQTYDKVLYVHDYILENTEYDHELADSDDVTDEGRLKRTAYGCLIDGKTVCSGYTLAFNLILQKMGFECGVEFNNELYEIPIFDGHVWSYCKLDGEYYYFDVTWDDVAPDSDMYKYYEYNHCYFAVTKEELSGSLEHRVWQKSTTPECNGTKYNYFIYNNMSFEKYDFEMVKSAIISESNEKYIILRFDDTSELLKAQWDLMDDGKIHSILSEKKNIRYLTSNSNRHLIIFYDN